MPTVERTFLHAVAQRKLGTMRLRGWLALSLVIHVGLTQFRSTALSVEEPRARRPMTIEILGEQRPDVSAFVSTIRGAHAESGSSVRMSRKVTGRALTHPVERIADRAASAAPEALASASANTAEPSASDDLDTSSTRGASPNALASPQASTTRITLPRALGSRERARYFGALRATVERHREYPLAARRMRLEGTVLVRISIARDGHIVAVHVRQSSGEAVLDNAAMSAVRSVASFPSAPAEVEGETFTLELPFVFRLRN